MMEPDGVSPRDPLALFALDAAVLRETARTLFRRPDRVHWSLASAALARVEQERLYEGYGYASLRAYAEEELDLAPSEVALLGRLWRMVATAHRDGRIEMSRWLAIPKAKAALLLRVLGLGGDATRWLMRAETLGMEELRAEVLRVLGEEIWLDFIVACPQEVVQLAEEVLAAALPEALGDPAAKAERVEERTSRFRCLEVLARHYLLCPHRGELQP